MQRGGSVHCEQNPGDVGVVLGAVLGEQAKSEHCPQVSLGSITGDLTLTSVLAILLEVKCDLMFAPFQTGK